MKMQRIKMLTGLLVLASAAFGSACSTGKATAQQTENPTKTVRPTETPTPPYKPLKRVSRDVIKTDTKDETQTVKVKK
jgi:ABC-type oligopeptide transport system substrate-binding subunit